MHFGNGAGNFGGSAVRRPGGDDSAAAMSKLVALLPNYMQIVQNWSEKVKLHVRKHMRSHHAEFAEVDELNTAAVPAELSPRYTVTGTTRRPSPPACREPHTAHRGVTRPQSAGSPVSGV